MATSGDETKISLRVYPNGGRNEIVGFSGGILRVKISAPPSKGKANRELRSFLSRLLGVAKGNVNIINGETARYKVVAIDGLSRSEVVERLLPETRA